MRQYLAIIFMVIFSFQVLPVRVLGKLMSKAQTEEEVKHSCDSGDDDAGLKAGKLNDLIFDTHFASIPYVIFSKRIGFIVHASDDLPASYITEIPSPPPNC